MFSALGSREMAQLKGRCRERGDTEPLILSSYTCFGRAEQCGWLQAGEQLAELGVQCASKACVLTILEHDICKIVFSCCDCFFLTI